MNTGSGVLTRMHTMLGFKPDRVYNLLPPSKVIGSWDKYQASLSAIELLKWFAYPSKALGIVLLGRKVATAFGFANAEWGSDFGIGKVQGLVVPHPSGRQRVVNDPEIRAMLLEQAKLFVSRVSN